MSYLHAVLLGLVQGLTEFFPVSSSAHLKLAKLLLGVEGDHLLFDLFCHFGTLCALIFFLRKEILQANFKQIFFALVPLVPFYFLLKPLREAACDVHFLGYFMILTSFILFIGGWIKLSRPVSPVKDAMMIGAMQGLALIPGISRSASTISTARSLGWNAREAVRFSFLLSIPTILGGTALESIKVIASKPEVFSFGPCLIGFFASLSFGLLIVPRAMGFLEKGNLKPFAWYCLLAGVLVTLCLR